MAELVLDDVRRILFEQFGIPGEEVRAEVRVFDGGLNLTSMQVLMLIASIEQRYGKRFDSADLVSENFCTIGRVVDSIGSRLVG